jgi:hypothetical protein
MFFVPSEDGVVPRSQSVRNDCGVKLCAKFTLGDSSRVRGRRTTLDFLGCGDERARQARDRLIVAGARDRHLETPEKLET